MLNQILGGFKSLNLTPPMITHMMKIVRAKSGYSEASNVSCRRAHCKMTLLVSGLGRYGYSLALLGYKRVHVRVRIWGWLGSALGALRCTGGGRDVIE